MAISKSVAVEAVKRAFMIVERDLSDEEYLEVCDELEDEFGSRANAKREEMGED